jgi:hypothetical protein
MARDVRQAVRTRSRAVAAKAEDQVKTVRTTNQEASSGKCVWTECGSRAPAACAREGKHVSCSDVRCRRDEAYGATHGKSIKQPNRHPKTAPHRIHNRHQRIPRLEPFDSRDELREPYVEKVKSAPFMFHHNSPPSVSAMTNLQTSPQTERKASGSRSSPTTSQHGSQ